MEKYPTFIWLLLTVAFVIILILHVLENKKLNVYLKKEYSPELSKSIQYFHWSRSIQLIFIMGFSFLLIMLYDLRIRELQGTLEATQETKLTNINDLRAELNKQKKESLKIPECYYPPIVADSKVKKPKRPKPPIKNTIQDIFGSSNDNTDANNTANNLKSRYEGILVTYFLMQKCEKTNPQDYQLIITELQKETSISNTSKHLKDDILTAAKGSYEEMYSHNDCTKEIIEATAIHYNKYMKSLSKNLPKGTVLPEN